MYILGVQPLLILLIADIKLPPQLQAHPSVPCSVSLGLGCFQHVKGHRAKGEVGGSFLFVPWSPWCSPQEWCLVSPAAALLWEVGVAGSQPPPLGSEQEHLMTNLRGLSFSHSFLLTTPSCRCLLPDNLEYTLYGSSS